MNLPATCACAEAVWANSTTAPMDQLTFQIKAYGLPEMALQRFAFHYYSINSFAALMDQLGNRDHFRSTRCNYIRMIIQNQILEGRSHLVKDPSQLVGWRIQDHSRCKAELTGLPFNVPGAGADGTALTKVSTETRPQNISLYALIRL